MSCMTIVNTNINFHCSTCPFLFLGVVVGIVPPGQKPWAALRDVKREKMLPTYRLLSPHKVNPPPSLADHLSARTRPAPALSSALNGSHCELGA